MDQALVFASIILGVAVALQLENLHRLLRFAEVKWHWAQPLFALLVLLLLMFFWWSLADNQSGSITLGEFLPIMWSLVLLVLLSAVALPEVEKGETTDLAAYYQANRRYMWGLVLLAGLPLGSEYLYRVATTSQSLSEAFDRGVGDLVAWLVIIAMVFVRRWWQVAVGFAILSLGPITWLSRTLG